MFEIKALIRPQRLEAVRTAPRELGDSPGVTVSTVGRAESRPSREYPRCGRPHVWFHWSSLLTPARMRP